MYQRGVGAFFVFNRLEVIPAGCGLPGRDIRKQTMSRIPVLIPSPCGVSRVAPKKDCSVMGLPPNYSSDSNSKSRVTVI